MIGRRSLLAGIASLALPQRVSAQGTRVSFHGSLEQGSLVIGKAAAEAKVTVDGNAVLVSDAGIFVFGLSYDAATPVHVRASFPDGVSESSDVTAIARTYEVQSIEGLPEKYVAPPPEVQARIEFERERVWEVRKRDTDGTDFVNPLEWPFPGILTSRYGNQRVLNGKPMAPHLGVDVAAPEGTPIHAAADGVVSLSDDFYIEGGLTLLDHGHGISTCYLHQSRRMVQVGQKVHRGEVIGLVGKTGRATGPHCHWGLSWFQVKLDPSSVTRTPTPPQLDGFMPATSKP